MNTRTNIVLDDELITQAMERAGVKTKKAAVEAALRAYVRRPDYAALLAAEGSRLVADDYDPKSPPTDDGSRVAREPTAGEVTSTGRKPRPGSKAKKR